GAARGAARERRGHRSGDAARQRLRADSRPQPRASHARSADRGAHHAGGRQAREPRAGAGRRALRGQAGRRGVLRPAHRLAGGDELCAIVRNDPSMTGVLFLLLEGPGDHAPEPRHEDKPDQVLAGDLPLATIVSAIAVLLQGDNATEADEAQVQLAQSPTAEVAPAAPAEEPAPPGAFELMKLAEAMQEIVVGQKT